MWPSHSERTSCEGWMITPANLTRDSLSDLSITEGGMENYILSHLDVLEAEAIHIMREVAAEFQRPVMLFSGGKDSICMLRLAEKAFRPSRFPFPLLHIDTGHNFPEVIAFRDRRAAELGQRLLVRSVEDSIRRGSVRLRAEGESRNAAQSVTLL